ncbi:uncharacterized, partial [Tachysurus ichikawai]
IRPAFGSHAANQITHVEIDKRSDCARFLPSLAADVCYQNNGENKTTEANSSSPAADPGGP